MTKNHPITLPLSPETIKDGSNDDGKTDGNGHIEKDETGHFNDDEFVENLFTKRVAALDWTPMKNVPDPVVSAVETSGFIIGAFKSPGTP